MAIARVLLFTTVLVLSGAGTPGLGADPYKPIVLVNSFPPNGPPDIVGRTSINKMLKLMTSFAAPAVTDLLAARAGNAIGLGLDRIVSVDRRAYGRGIPGTLDVVNSPADGDTLLFSNSIELLTRSRLYRLSYRPQRDLIPVAAIARMPIVMIARTQSGVNTVRAFLDAARNTPGALDYASSGDFRSGHLAGELFAMRAGVSLVHVSYNGGNDAVNGVIKGQVPVAFVPLPSALPAIPGGKIRVIGIADAMRLEALPDVPTISESGVPDFQADSWFGIYAPAGTPADVVARLNDAVIYGLRATRTESLLVAGGLQARYPGAAEFGEFILAEQNKWTPVLNRMNPPY